MIASLAVLQGARVEGVWEARPFAVEEVSHAAKNIGACVAAAAE